jgi:hypothetical protein
LVPALWAAALGLNGQEPPPTDLPKRLEEFRAYVRALKRFGSSDEAEWACGAAELRERVPAGAWKDVADLVERAPRDAAARRELARRGRVYELAQVFSEGYDARHWRRTWEEYRTLGPDAVDHLAEILLRQLLTMQRHDVWEPVRYYLVECGEPGLRQTQAMVQTLVNGVVRREAEGGAALPTAPLAQCLQVLINFGDVSREPILKLCAHDSAQIRGAAADALGASRDPSYAPTLAKLASDREWTVRAAAVEALGHQRYRRAESVALLGDRLSVESHPTVKLKIVESLGELRDASAVPRVLAELDAAERRWNELFGRVERERGRLGIAPLEKAAGAQQAEVDQGRRARVDHALARELRLKQDELQPHVDAAMAHKDFMDKLMYNLWKITGQKLNTPAKWRDWWSRRPGASR